MDVEILNGGSGHWNFVFSGYRMACGHVPKRLNPDERRAVIERQLRRQLMAGQYEGIWPKLGGGYFSTAHVDDDLLTAALEVHAERRQEAIRWLLTLDGQTCRVCGKPARVEIARRRGVHDNAQSMLVLCDCLHIGGRIDPNDGVETVKRQLARQFEAAND